MSKLATALPTPETFVPERYRRGPSGACDIYGDGELDDWAAIQRLRNGSSWAQVQAEVDRILGVKAIDTDKFRYHWSRRCWHWTQAQRDVRLEDMP